MERVPLRDAITTLRFQWNSIAGGWERVSVVELGNRAKGDWSPMISSRTSLLAKVSHQSSHRYPIMSINFGLAIYYHLEERAAQEQDCSPGRDFCKSASTRRSNGKLANLLHNLLKQLLGRRVASSNYTSGNQGSETVLGFRPESLLSD